MRFVSLLLFLICTTFQAFAQEHPCGTVLPEGYQPPHEVNSAEFQEYKSQFLRDYELRQSKNGTSQRASGSCINSVPLSIWLVSTTAGTGGYTLGELDAALAIVNTRYASACLEFYTCDINYINSDTYYDFDEAEEAALVAAHFTADAMNVYFVNSVADGASAYCGYAYYPNVSSLNVVMMDNSCANNGSTLAHELGHAYSLPHTHNGGTELVDGSNCSTAGDKFCDTAADPNVSGDVNVSCVYTGSATDANGDPYAPDPNNIMSYSRKACRTFFSPEQLAAISFANFNAADRNDLACTSFEVDFSTPLQAICGTSDPVTFTDGSAGATSYDWDFDNDGTTDATGATPAGHVFGAAGSYDVALEISDGANTIRRLKLGYVSVGGQAYPYANNLSSFPVNTTASGYPAGWSPTPTGGFQEYQWNVYDAASPSPSTGPDGGYAVSGFSGNYLCLEASGTHTAGVSQATLETHCIDIPAMGVEANPVLEFYYHMYGSTMGELHVDIEVAGTWTNDIMTAIVGQQQTASSDPYLLQSIPLSTYANSTVRFRFRGIYGTNFNGDIAIDEIALTAGAPLPVELISFHGKQFDDGSNQLVWNTASEVNADFFELQRSEDGRTFVPITKLNAKGSSIEATAYQHIDDAPSKGDNYYRLRMVDYDGSEEYSPIVALRSERDEQRVELFPNPANTSLTLVGTDVSDFVEIRNHLGQQLLTARILDGSGQFTISTSALPAGLYSLRLLTRDGEVKAVRKVQVAH